MSEAEHYADMTNRNIGLLTQEQQKALHDMTIAVYGAGGLGGVVAQLLVRSGVGAIQIVDSDRFEVTNLNRQVFCTTHTVGQWKVEATAQALRDINPHLRIKTFRALDVQTNTEILQGASAAVMAIDKTVPCIMASRGCRERGIPLIEGWAIPYLNVRVLTRDTPSLEETYDLPTQALSLEELQRKSGDEIRELDALMLRALASVEGLARFYPPDVVQQIFERGRIPSFAPMVWLTASLMALETVKVVLGWETFALAPRLAMYDPFRHVIPQ